MEKQIVGNTGLYYVCYKLSGRGWNVMSTARNARGVDVICFSSDAKRMLSVQVKSLSKRLAVGLGQNFDNVMGDFWIIVTRLALDQPQAYVAPVGSQGDGGSGQGRQEVVLARTKTLRRGRICGEVVSRRIEPGAREAAAPPLRRRTMSSRIARDLECRVSEP